MLISCVIIDDEKPSIHYIEKCIEKVPFLKLEASFTDPNAAVSYLQSNPAALIFVDIEMPNFDINGLDVMRILGEQRYIVITANPKYALDAFEHSVADFLHKPFDFNRFSRAVEKVRITMEREQDEATLPVLSESTYIRSAGKLRRVYFDDIYWIEADRNTSTIVTRDEQFSTPLSILSLEAQLPKGFFGRVHKSYVISYEKIEFVERDQIGIRRGETLKLLSIGDPYKKSFMDFVGARTMKGK